MLIKFLIFQLPIALEYQTWLFLMVPWVGLQCGFVVLSDHTHLPFGTI